MNSDNDNMNALKAQDLIDLALHQNGSMDDATGLYVERIDSGYHLAYLPYDKDNTPLKLQSISVLASRDDAILLAKKIFDEVDLQISEVNELISNGKLPKEVSTFSELHDYFDANSLGSGEDDVVFEPHPLIGVGVDDLSEAWCGYFNCAHEGVNRELQSKATPTSGIRLHG